MPPDNAFSPITRYFDARQSKIYTQYDIISIFKLNRTKWKLVDNATAQTFIAFLLQKTKLQRVTTITSLHSRYTRYVWGDLSPYIFALAIRSNSYLSHATAVFLHGLIDEEPNDIYVNQEQSQKPPPSMAPTQETIDLACEPQDWNVR